MPAAPAPRLQLLRACLRAQHVNMIERFPAYGDRLRHMATLPV